MASPDSRRGGIVRTGGYFAGGEHKARPSACDPRTEDHHSADYAGGQVPYPSPASPVRGPLLNLAH